jgi:uncharacterized cupredoxin-like copper-binding protein
MRVTGAWWRAALALGVAVGVVALLAGPAAPADNATSASVVSVALSEWKLEPGQVTVRGGRVSFVVRNDGTMAHEFLVLRSERHHHVLKVKGGKAVETGRLGRIPQIAVGESKRLSLKITPGKYVLLCNMLGHYQAGQYASLRVR